jgi:lysophospholipase L1-like esterase
MRADRFIVTLFALAACGHPSTRQAAPAAPLASAAPQAAAAPAVDRFESEIALFEASDRAAPPAQGGILFTGSSSIRLWKSLESDFAGLPIMNRGFGGSTMPEMNHYVPRIVLPYRPRMIVLYEGDNDIAAGRTPQQVADDYRTFLRLVRPTLPAARIVFVAIKPSPSRWSNIEKVREANRLVREIVSTDTLQTFADVFTPTLGANGRPRAELVVGDSLHMTPAGYAVWRRVLAPIVH